MIFSVPCMTTVPAPFALGIVALFAIKEIQALNANVPNVPPVRNDVVIDIENYGIVTLAVPPTGQLIGQPLPDVDITNAVARSDITATCFFAKWPAQDMPADDGEFISIPIQANPRTDFEARDVAIPFDTFEKAQRVFCYDSTEEQSRTGQVTLIFRMPDGVYQKYDLERNSASAASVGGMVSVDFMQESLFSDRKMVAGMGIVYPAIQEMYCRLYYRELADYRSFREYRTVYVGRSATYDPPVPFRRVNCYIPPPYY